MMDKIFYVDEIIKKSDDTKLQVYWDHIRKELNEIRQERNELKHDIEAITTAGRVLLHLIRGF